MNYRKLKDYLMSGLLRVVPRSNSVWVTGDIKSWDYKNIPPAFFDNSKYFFLYLHEKTDEHVYWLSNSEREKELLKSMNLPVVDYNTFRGKWIVARAKYSFHHYGDYTINKLAQLGMTQINFWHGTPIKKIVYDVEPRQTHKYDYAVKLLDRGGNHYLASTSDYLSRTVYQNAFDMDKDHILIYGYPRTDIFKFTKRQIIEFCNKYSKDLIVYINLIKEQKVMLYMPTFRDDDYDYFKKADIDYHRLNDALLRNNYLLFIKLHPLTNNDLNIETYSNIVLISNDVDIYPLFKFVDFLITDYSSVFFDFLLMDKEIIFIPYDFDDYVSNRKLYYDYKEITPGKHYISFDDFINSIDDLDKLDFSERRKKLKNLFHENYQFDACEKTYKYLKEHEK